MSMARCGSSCFRRDPSWLSTSPRLAARPAPSGRRPPIFGEAFASDQRLARRGPAWSKHLVPIGWTRNTFDLSAATKNTGELSSPQSLRYFLSSTTSGSPSRGDLCGGKSTGDEAPLVGSSSTSKSVTGLSSSAARPARPAPPCRSRTAHPPIKSATCSSGHRHRR